MRSGTRIDVQGVGVVLWDRAPHSLSDSLYDPWWVTREGIHGDTELWAIGRRRHHGRYAADNWTFIGRFDWQGARF